MSSKRQIAANRANAALSHGPITPAGIQRSSRNALRHGLLAKIICLQDEDPDLLQKLWDNHLARFNPADEVESSLVEQVVSATWRLRRAWAIETRILDNESSSQPAPDPLDSVSSAFAGLSAGHALTLLYRYQSHLLLQYQRALSSLLLVRNAFPTRPGPTIDLPRDVRNGE